MNDTDNISQRLATIAVHTGESLDELSRDDRVLLVFLRHGGCPFCREALSDLSKQRAAIEADHVRIVLVHMMDDESAAALFGKYELNDLARISDPGKRVYDAFELQRGGVGQVMGPRVWWRGFVATVMRGHLPGKPSGDVFQLPGAVVIHQGRIIAAERPTTSAVRTDFEQLAACRL